MQRSKACPAFHSSRQHEHCPQPGKPASTTGTRYHRSSSCSGSITAASSQPYKDAKPAVKAPLLPLLGGLKFSCCRSSQSKQPAFCSRNEGTAKPDGFCRRRQELEGRAHLPAARRRQPHWDGEPAIPALPCWGSSGGPCPTPRHNPVPLQSPLSACIWNIPASRPPSP